MPFIKSEGDVPFAGERSDFRGKLTHEIDDIGDPGVVDPCIELRVPHRDELMCKSRDRVREFRADTVRNDPKQMPPDTCGKILDTKVDNPACGLSQETSTRSAVVRSSATFATAAPRASSSPR